MTNTRLAAINALDVRHADILPRELHVPLIDPPTFFTNDLNRAGCGYDFLLQSSNAVSAGAAFDSLRLNWVIGAVDAAALAALRAGGIAPVSAALSALLEPDASSTGGGADLLIVFKRKDVLFDSQTTCRVRADVQLALGRLHRIPAVPPVAHDPLPGEAESIHPNWTIERLGVEVARGTQAAIKGRIESAGVSGRQQVVDSPHLLGARRAPPAALPFTSGTFSFGDDSVEMIDVQSYMPKHVQLGFRDSFDVTSWLGVGVLEVAAPFGATGNQTSATIRVPADVSNCSPVFTNLTRDAVLLLSAADPAGLVALTTRRIRERGQLQLVDEISLVGGPATARVNNLSQLQPKAFPCGLGACPLSVGAVIVAWHVGAPAAVRIVGNSGYGVLWSAEAVALMVRYCWENKYFPRIILQSMAVKLTVDGSEQEAAAESDIVLQALTTVSLQYDANDRTDVLHFGGNAQVVPRRFRLADGRVLLPANPTDPIFAPGVLRAWNALGTLTEQSPGGTAPDVVRFQRDVTRTTTSRLGRPFTESTSSEVTYSRISAYAQRILLLAE